MERARPCKKHRPGAPWGSPKEERVMGKAAISSMRPCGKGECKERGVGLPDVKKKLKEVSPSISGPPELDEARTPSPQKKTLLEEGR